MKPPSKGQIKRWLQAINAAMPKVPNIFTASFGNSLLVREARMDENTLQIQAFRTQTGVTFRISDEASTYDFEMPLHELGRMVHPHNIVSVYRDMLEQVACMHHPFVMDELVV